MTKLVIQRNDSTSSWYDTFHIKEKKGMTVLDALFHIQEKVDGSLCFRYSCRGAVCGSCAMLINRVPRLACKTQISTIKKEIINESNSNDVLLKNKEMDEFKEEILIEPLPLPNSNIIKDLVVDLEPFFDLVYSIKPWIDEGRHDNTDPNTLIEPAMHEKIDQFTNCILCSLCHSICPAFKHDEQYMGPATLAKAWRYYLDPRNDQESKNDLLNTINTENGVWGCDVVYKCVGICPKKVPPTKGILNLRDVIKK